MHLLDLMLATSKSKSEELNIWKADQTCFNTSTHYSELQNTFSLLLKIASFTKMTVLCVETDAI